MVHKSQVYNRPCKDCKFSYIGTKKCPYLKEHLNTNIMLKNNIYLNLTLRGRYGNINIYLFFFLYKLIHDVQNVKKLAF